jgi:O-antigen ligase
MSGFEGGRKALPLVLLAPVVLVWDRASLNPYFEPKILALDITTVIILLSVFAFKRRIEKSFSVFDFLIFCWIGFSAVSLVFLPDFRIGINDLILRTSAFFVFVILRWVAVTTEELQKDTAVALLVLAEIQAVFITGQWFFSLVGGLDAWDNRMLLGTLGFHTFAASFIGFCLVFALPLFKEFSPKTQFLMAAIYVHCLLVLILLQCRAVFLALVIVAAINGFWFLIEWEKNNVWLKNIAKTFVVVAILVVVPTTIFFLTSEKAGGMWQRTKEDIFGEKLTGRRLIWRTAVEMVKEKPITGFGIGGFYYNYIPFQGKVLSQTNPKNFYPVREMVIWAHNDFLQEVVENGLAGFLLFLLTILPFFYLIFKKRKELWIRALALSLAFYFIVAFVDFPLHRPVEASLFMLLAAFVGRWIAKKRAGRLK